MPRHAYHDPAPPACCCDCGGGCTSAPAPCYYPAPVPAPCYYPAPVPVPAPAPAPTSSSATDHLLHAIAAHLLLGSSAPAPAPQPQPQQQPPPPPPAAHQATNPYPGYAHHYQYQQQEAKTHAYAHPPPPQPGASDHAHLLLHSLLRRVAALESALPRCFPPPPPAWRAPHPTPRPRPRRVARQELVADHDTDEETAGSDSSPPSPPPPRHRRPPPRRPTRAGPPSSARDLAARTIQAHFRRFLARRSRTLRQLKELAVLRSKSAALRGSLSGRQGGADPAAVSEATMGLLFRLDAIQGGDPMIREGKRAVSRELTRILEFVDKVLVKEHEQLPVRDNGDYHEGCSAEFVSSRPAVNKKKVSFSSNGRIHELNGATEEFDEGSESSGSADESDEVKGMPGKRSANGQPGFAAPKPVHMEARKVAGERR
ncbi:hypothetical protein PR202_ga05637 [Eleusine coracana subsp. coracana]|uniref:BAG domain-containing protein n=1 Tax=Eleusine coracana subsp. coracana TaxID=191504 RepID=A0AAV5BRI3_ELECO|nr:hypothetical protein QOZ80_5AG0367000 [Eleusine coracana subsp. coracana]GJM89041.1 hypothetical protein PR202_ga05183 [Eleusine coracana subsp. coracana]GJM89442.1 hypothetical protein PR202_ga05637 [Eleusine coracana subsp. coracana]